ncbi:MAG TPA: PilZ domain-containing protein [Polyangiales bacterium]|jgi:hypothetical protein|nr:PilZ domain-containing protein [Polyangiales bacterium]
MQRREHARYKLWLPVQMSAGGEAKLAVVHNMGAGGMLIALCAEVKVGEPVSVRFQLPTGDSQRELQAHIVHVERNAEDPDGEWPFKVGIAFDEVSSDLIPALELAVSRFGG